MMKRKGTKFEDKQRTTDVELRTAEHGGGGDTMVWVQILPLHAIGGYGKAGDVVEMPLELARAYEREGYVIVISD